MLSDEYIFQEILEQERIAALHQTSSVPDWPDGAGKIIITGSGDSHCAALFGHWLLKMRGEVSGLPSNQFGYFLNSETQAQVFPVPNSQGVLCLGGQIGRYNASVFNSGATGTGSLPW